MFLRAIASIVLVLAAAGAWLGNSPGRHTTRDVSNCFLFGLFDYWTEEHPARTRTYRLWNLFDVTESSEARHHCQPQIVEQTCSAVDGAVVVALIAVAIFAAFAALIPRRWMAGIWLGGAAIAAFLAFVVTRSWTVRPGETIAYWPRYATWIIVAAIAAAMLVVAGWLIAEPASPAPASAARPPEADPRSPRR